MFDSAESAERSFGWLIAVILVLFALSVISVLDQPNVNSSSSYYEKCAEYNLGKAIVQDGAPGNQAAKSSNQSLKEAADWCDLVAQQSMAESTFAAARASIWTAILTGVGVVFLGFTLWYTKSTLEQTSTTADIARESLVAQQRPWLNIKLVESRFNSTHTEFQAQPRFEISNKGMSSAVIFAIDVQMLSLDTNNEFIEIWDNHFKSTTVRDSVQSIFPNDVETHGRHCSGRITRHRTTGFNGEWVFDGLISISCIYGMSGKDFMFQTSRLFPVAANGSPYVKESDLPVRNYRTSSSLPPYNSRTT